MLARFKVGGSWKPNDLEVSVLKRDSAREIALRDCCGGVAPSRALFSAGTEPCVEVSSVTTAHSAAILFVQRVISLATFSKSSLQEATPSVASPSISMSDLGRRGVLRTGRSGLG